MAILEQEHPNSTLPIAGGADPLPVAVSKRPASYVWLLGILLAIATLAAFHQVLSSDFVEWDDNIHILLNHHFDHVTWRSLGFFWTHSYENLYIPISYIVFGLIANASRLPAGQMPVSDTNALYLPHLFHVASLAFHVVNVLLVFALIRLIVKKDMPAAVGSLLFAIHPLQVESVAWISELRGLLGSFFILSGLLAYVGYLQSTQRNPSGKIRFAYYGLTVLLAVLALLSKPSAVVFAPIAFVLAWAFFGRTLKQAFRELLPIALLGIPFTIITHHIQPVTSGENVVLWKRFFIFGDALSFYIAKFFVPIKLGIDYGRKPSFVLAHTWGYVTWVIPAALAFGTYKLRYRVPYLGPAALVTLLALLPVLGLTPFVFQNYSTVADRYTYLAFLGPALATAAFLASTTRVKHTRIASTVLIVFGIWFAFLTLHQCQFWKNSEILYLRAIAVNPDSSAMRDNLAVILMAKKRPLEAVQYLHPAVLNHRDEAIGHQEMGDALYMLHDVKSAVQEYKIVAILKPNDPSVLYNLGVLYRGIGDERDAIDAFQGSLAINPAFSKSAINLGSIYFKKGDYKDAVHTYVSVLLKDNTHSDVWTSLGVSLLAEGRTQEAATALQSAIQLDPHNEKAQRALDSTRSALARQAVQPG